MSRVRRNIKDLSEEDVNLLEKAFQGIIARDEVEDLSQPIDEAHPERISFFRLASFHGYITYHCYHGSNNFFHWHRKYVYLFEEALRSVPGCSKVTLPYLDTTAKNVDFPDWIWTRPTFASYKIPHKYLVVDPNFVALNRDNKETHFLDYEKLCEEYGDKSPNGQTTRDTKANIIEYIQSHPQDFYERVDDHVYQIGYFPTLSNLLGAVHGSGHDAIGGPTGNMNSVPVAGFDPIFWFHHSNVERWLWIWENRHELQNSRDYYRVFPLKDDDFSQHFQDYFEVGNGLTQVLKQHRFDFQGFKGTVNDVLDNPQIYKIPYETHDNVTPTGALSAFSLGTVEHGPITVGSQFSILVKNIDRSNISGSFYVILTVNGKEYKDYIFQIGPTCANCENKPFISSNFLVKETPVTVSFRAVDRRGNELNIGSPSLNIRLPLHAGVGDNANIINA